MTVAFLLNPDISPYLERSYLKWEKKNKEYPAEIF